MRIRRELGAAGYRGRKLLGYRLVARARIGSGSSCKLNEEAFPVPVTVYPALMRSPDTVAASPLVPSPFRTSTWIDDAGTVVDAPLWIRWAWSWVSQVVVPNALN